jgi:hypothetical protein
MVGRRRQPWPWRAGGGRLTNGWSLLPSIFSKEKQWPLVSRGGNNKPGLQARPLRSSPIFSPLPLLLLRTISKRSRQWSVSEEVEEEGAGLWFPDLSGLLK